MSLRTSHRRLQQTADIPRTTERGEQGWMTSYADITTALMCFFLIFFASSNIQKDENIVDSLIVSLGSKTNENVASAPEAQAPTLEESLTNIPGVFITKGERSVTVDFEGGTFFNSASTKLTEEGIRSINNFMSAIAPFKDKIFVEIRGHSDNVPVIYMEKRRFKNNTELSTLRALRVFKVFTSQGYASQSLAVSGFGSSMTVRDEQGNANLKDSRRITFRITEQEST